VVLLTMLPFIAGDSSRLHQKGISSKGK